MGMARSDQRQIAAGGGPAKDERHSRDRAIWTLVKRQHGVVTHRQLAGLGLGRSSIHWRVKRGRLHPVARGVYAVGRPQLSRHGGWMVALLAGGDGAALSHGSAAALWGFGREPRGVVEISLPDGRRCRRPGIRAHRRAKLGPEELVTREGLLVTTPVRTLIDEATRLRPLQLERAVNEADKLNLVSPDALRAALDGYLGVPGVPALCGLLDRHTFRLSDSDLEILFRPLAREVGLPVPETKALVNGHEVDFFWPDLGLVVETDGLQYHRTPSQQTRGLRRDHDHLVANLWSVRFSHWQVKHEPAHVRSVLRSAAARARTAKSASRE